MIDFENDDSFMLEALEVVEEFEAQDSRTSLTPPDSEVFNRLKSVINSPNNCHKSTLNSGTDKSASESDFRSKLMKSLIHSQNVNRSSCFSKFESKLLKNSNGSISTDEFLTPLKRKFGSKESVEPKTDQFHLKVSKVSPDRINASNIVKNHDNQISKEFISRNESSTLLMKDIQSAISPVNSIIRKRKFPGPAGLLPKWDPRTPLKSDSSNEISKYEQESSEDPICSQTTAQDFASGTWKQMLTDLDKLSNRSQHLLQNNVRWILRRASLKGLASIRKVPFVAVMVRSVDLNHQDATAVFQDETGEIPGTISKKVLEKYSDYISSGTVLVLKDLTILSPATSQSGKGVMSHLKRHYLNITLNSIMSIYSLDEGGEVKKLEVVEMTKSLIENLLRVQEKGSKEKIQVIENEENPEKLTEVSLFDGFSKVEQVTNRRDLPQYKSPFGANASTKSPLPNGDRKHQSRFANVNSATPSRQQNNGTRPAAPAGLGLSVSISKPSTSFTFITSSETRPKSNPDPFQSFGDDDELDDILASINTDAL